MSRKNSKLFVTKFPDDYSGNDLEDLFEKYGKIREVSMKKGYAFVDYYDHHDADEAIDRLDGKDLEGKKTGRMSFQRQRRPQIRRT